MYVTISATKVHTIPPPAREPTATGRLQPRITLCPCALYVTVTSPVILFAKFFSRRKRRIFATSPLIRPSCTTCVSSGCCSVDGWIVCNTFWPRCRTLHRHKRRTSGCVSVYTLRTDSLLPPFFSKCRPALQPPNPAHGPSCSTERWLHNVVHAPFTCAARKIEKICEDCFADCFANTIKCVTARDTRDVPGPTNPTTSRATLDPLHRLFQRWMNHRRTFAG